MAEGFGGKGFLLDRPEDINDIFAKAKDTARSGKTDLHKGSISM